MLKGTHQYQISAPALFRQEWKVSSSQENQAHWIQFNIFTPTLLTDSNRNPMGKIYCPKILTLKKNIDISTKDALVRASWFKTFRSFKVSGVSDIKGFESIEWIWRRQGMNSGLILEDKQTGRCIAEFDRHRFSVGTIGDIFIFEDLPSELNWLIVFSACYSHRGIKREERSRGGGGP
ncbi:hypothetical protein CONCODRAFT_169207 [Conidiobolus coronatus NRRL 28638]|uniref:Uncharacterized protein n=1 Tax=Conidiobolus coronatus (strain ATCC 28846 / CBS 209.66 / NRRL 28638) TaxID=796925 RepID=A0A137NSG4_CONC2|nr:hypothetical protein CONCODRAFT_169207 [Conidiobolus coronatus NRRL 28638]|eukprot:KXN65630.1 hypothetical protein CONCODRAFT_169207 [Conidiobolus coronatus NRRL 28638]